MENRPPILSLILKMSQLEERIKTDIEERSRVMRYKVKDPHLATVLKNNGYDEKEISRRCYVAFNGLERNGRARFPLGCGGALTLTKAYVEEIPTYTPGAWNEYPAVLPPKEDSYLVTVYCDSHTCLDIARWLGDEWDRYSNDRIIAFKDRPEPFQPKPDEIDADVCLRRTHSSKEDEE